MYLSFEKTTEYWSNLLELWRVWRIWKSLSDVQRSGLIFCGANRKHFKNRLLDFCAGSLIAFFRWCLVKLGATREESVSEHVYGTILLLDLMARFGLLPKGVSALAKIMMPYHEPDEVVSMSDDVDDGSQDAGYKAQATKEGLEYAFAETPNTEPTVRLILQADRMKGISFEEIPRTSLYEVAAWCAKAIDKTEAVLQNVRLRDLGVVGRIGRKENPSPGDMQAVRELGTDDITFVWAWNSALYLQGTVLWDLLLVAIHDIYPEEEIPEQFRLVK